MSDLATTSASGDGCRPGRLHGVGVGPGDPELMTIRATRLIGAAPVVAFFAKAGRRGNARAIADRWIDPRARELQLAYPITTEVAFTDPVYVAALRAFYDDAAARLSACLEEGADVALLCEGDPLFYGSFMHIYTRLRDRFAVTICPGVTSMAGCAAAAGHPMTWGDDVLAVLPGTLPTDVLERRVADADAAVVLKLGGNFARVRAAIERAGRLERAIYVERGTMTAEVVLPLRDKQGEAPYFALILIPGEGRRP